MPSCVCGFKFFNEANRHCSECPISILTKENTAMRRSLTDIMRFSSDDRSRAVAKGALDDHGGPDPKEPEHQKSE